MPFTADIPALVVASLFLCLVLAGMISDLLCFRIPNLLSVGLLLLFPFSALLAPDPVDWIQHLGAGLLLLALGAGLFALGRLGGGDVKLLAALALWTGFELLPAFLLVMALSGGVFAVALLLLRPRLSLTAPLWGRFGLDLPRVLRPGEGVPYGVAIGAAALYLSPQILQLGG